MEWGGAPRDSACRLASAVSDASDGELVQRINLDVTALVARREFDRRRSLLPGLMWLPSRIATPVGPEVRIDTGLVVGVGNQVKVLQSRAALRK